jgi:AbrB family looped-hinge helix DNA binding protein
MPIAKMTSRGRVTVPKEVRKRLHLKPHDKISFSIEEDHAILRQLDSVPNITRREP